MRIARFARLAIPIVAVSLIAAACSTSVPSPPDGPTQTEDPGLHQVQDGETLYGIASTYCSSASEAIKAILELNRDGEQVDGGSLQTADDIKVGWLLQITCGPEIEIEPPPTQTSSTTPSGVTTPESSDVVPTTTTSTQTTAAVDPTTSEAPSTTATAPTRQTTVEAPSTTQTTAAVATTTTPAALDVCRKKDFTIFDWEPRLFIAPDQHLGGDLDFHGNGPKIELDVDVRLVPPKIFVDLTMRATETKSDYTQFYGEQTFHVDSIPSGWGVPRFDVTFDPIEYESGGSKGLFENRITTNQRWFDEGPVDHITFTGDSDGLDLGVTSAGVQLRPYVIRIEETRPGCVKVLD